MSSGATLETARGGRRGAFSRAEVLIGLAALAVIAAVAVPNLREFQRRSREKACYANLRTLAGAVQWYSADLDREYTITGEGDFAPLLENGYLMERLACPSKGTYTCAAGEKRCECSEHGRVDATAAEP